MSLSNHQRRLLGLLQKGHQLRIVRSLIDRAPVYAELLCPAAQHVETIQWWRVTRLLKTRLFRLDTGDVGTATSVLPVSCSLQDGYVQAVEDALTP